MKVLFIGDVIGEAGKLSVLRVLPALKKEVDFVIVSGESINKSGAGIKKCDIEELAGTGVDCIVSGEKVWSERETFNFLKSNPTSILRPLNYPTGVPGIGSCIYPNKSVKSGIGVINLLGRSFLANIDCPFRVGMEKIMELRTQTNIIIVDFHGQTTAEKQAFSWFVDGKVSAVIGTHTLIQTGDERIFPKGTAYITSVGLTGVQDAIGGMQKKGCIEYFLTGIPAKFKPASGDGKLNAVLIKIDNSTGKALKIERFYNI